MLSRVVGPPTPSCFVLLCWSLAIAASLSTTLEGAVHSGRVPWTHLSSSSGGLPQTNGGDQQTSCVIADVDNDGDADFFIAERTRAPSVILYRRVGSGWQRYVIDNTILEIEAGGDAADIDGDGDLDLAFGQDASGGNLWWWENPFPSLNAGTPWQRRFIRSSSVRHQQHDQRFGDFDGDGQLEFATWQNRSDLVDIYEIPSNPTSSPWPRIEQIAMSGEGMDVVDMDLDGKADLLAGGAWIRHSSGNNYAKQAIDASYTGVRIIGGQFIPGGRPEVLMNSGDANGPLNFYWLDGTTWRKRTLVSEVIHGHTLEAGDVDGDGHLDFFAAEMGNPGAGANAKGWIGYGDGAGNFTLEVITTGLGHHMSRLADLDGDGDLDIVVKPYSYNAPRVDVLLNNRPRPTLSLTNWQRRLIDSSLPAIAIFVEAADLNRDGHMDLVAGAHWWQNPGALGGSWTRRTVGTGFNNLVTIQDFDGDGDADLLGTQGVGNESNHSFRWARNNGSGTFSILGNINTGGSGDFLQGRVSGRFQANAWQVLLSWHNGGGGVQALTVPADPVNQTWTFQTLSTTTLQEDLSAGDIDGDGDLDILLGTQWFENRGSSWTVHTLGNLSGLGSAEPDRNDLADVDGDGDLDAVVGLENGDEILWFRNPRPGGAATGQWTRNIIGLVAGQGFSMDTRDLNGDGLPEVVVGEHQGSGVNRVILFENTGATQNWPSHIVDSQATGTIDHHDGTQFADMDGDGDLDIISIGWHRRKLWIFENTSPALPSTNAPPDPLEGPLLFHHSFEEESGSIVLDSSVNDVDGSLQGNATRTASGHTGKAIEFNGSSSRISLDPFDPTGSAFSLALWFKADDFGVSDARLISKAQGTDENQHFFMLSTVSAGGGIGLRFRLKTTVGGTTTLVGEGPLLAAGAWTHVAATYDGATMRLYQNGAQIGSAAKSGVLANGVGVQTWIGGNPDGSRYFDGVIDEVRCYSVALSAAEVQALAAPGSEPDTQPPSAPPSLTAQASSPTTVMLSWGASSDNVGVTAYRIHRDGTQIGSTATRSFTDTGLSSGATYQYRVSALDAAGNESPLSQAAPATTHGTVTVAVVGNGSVSRSPNQSSYPSGTVVALTASAQAGWAFSHWSGDASGNSNPVSISVLGPESVTATFTNLPAPPVIQSEPADVTVFENVGATFEVTATGSSPLSYQWRRDGGAIPGATQPSYSLISSSSADDGAGFEVIVANGAGAVTSRVARLTVLPLGSRVEDGLVALYGFNERADTTVHDLSGVGTPLNLTILDENRIQWLDGTNNGVRIMSGGSAIRSSASANKIHSALKASGRLTVEAWITPATLNQTGPARIVALSAGTATSLVNLQLGQGGFGDDGEFGDFRLRTSRNDLSWLQAEHAFTNTAIPRHVVLTYDGTVQRFYLDGARLGAEQPLQGDLSNWDATFPLILGNEATLDRSWLGSLHLVAIYERALSPLEIQQNFSAGPNVAAVQLPPEISEHPADVTVHQPAAATFSIQATGTPPLNYQWRRNQTPIQGANESTYTLETTSKEADDGTQFDVIVSNAAGSVASLTAILTVIDSIPPEISCPSNTTVECASTWEFDPPTASDEGSTPTVVVVSTITNTAGFCGGTFEVTRTWRATDEAGNQAECAQTVTVVDITPPTIACAADTEHAAGEEWDFDAPTAADECGGATIQVVNTVTNDLGAGAFEAIRTWEVADLCGNVAMCSQTVTVGDSTPPTLDCPQDNTVGCGSAWDFEEPVASDLGSIPTVVVVSTLTNAGGFCGGTFEVTRTWRATDEAGNQAECAQTVTVVDMTPPTIACAADTEHAAGEEWDFDAPTAADECGGATVQVVSTVTNDLGAGAFEAIRTWEVADLCGNVAMCSQTVTVGDSTPPTIECPADNTVGCGSAWDFEEPAASDPGSIPTVVVVSTLTNAGGFCGGTFEVTRTWRATDEAGNQAECAQTVTVVDITPPTIACAADTEHAVGEEWDFDAPTAADECGGATIQVVNTVTNDLGAGAFEAIRTWEVADLCGNVAMCSQTVTAFQTAGLRVEMVDGLVRISWPASLVGHVLEENAGLLDDQWTQSVYEPTVEGGWNVITRHVKSRARFFRLRRL